MKKEEGRIDPSMIRSEVRPAQNIHIPPEATQNNLSETRRSPAAPRMIVSVGAPVSASKASQTCPPEMAS